MSDTVNINAEELSGLTRRAFERAGFCQSDAEAAAEILVTTDLMGISTHGVHRLEQYIKRVRAGMINSAPKIVADDRAPALAILDGDDGQGQVVAARALELAMTKARANGIAFVTVKNSNHFGATAPYGFAASVAAMVLMCGTSASPAMAPFGGRDLKMGNNPFGFAAPRRSDAPFILDMAMSIAARGKMRKLRDLGEAMPIGWALDVNGNPTTDPVAGLNGFIQFIGGHKGYGLSLMVEMLGGLLSGGRFLDDVGDMWAENEPQGVSHFFIVIDPIRLMGAGDYYDRMESFVNKVKASAPFYENGEVLIPGELEYRAIQERRKDGIPLTIELLDTVKRLASA